MSILNRYLFIISLLLLIFLLPFSSVHVNHIADRALANAEAKVNRALAKLSQKGLGLWRSGQRASVALDDPEIIRAVLLDKRGGKERSEGEDINQTDFKYMHKAFYFSKFQNRQFLLRLETQRRSFVAYIIFPEDHCIILEWQNNMIYNEANKIQRAGLVAVLIVIVLFSYFGLSMTGTFVRPVLELRSLADFHARDLQAPLKIPRGENEISELSRSFNRLMAVSRERKKQLQTVKGHFEKQHRNLSAELDHARKIQKNLLQPDLPESFLKLSISSIGLRKVSGDYYNFTENADGSIDMVIADVSGHGVPAAMITIMAHFYFRESNGEMNPVQFLQYLNAKMVSLVKTGGFITAFHIRFHPDGTSEFANAGHASPILIPKHGAILKLPAAGGPVIGLSAEDGDAFRSGSLSLNPGDRIIFCSDGLTECINRHGDHYGTERFIRTAARCRDRKTEALKKEILSDLRQFRGAAPLRDDVTLIIAEFAP